MAEMGAVDFFTVQPLTFRTLNVFVILSPDRRRVVQFSETSDVFAGENNARFIRQLF